MNLTEYVKSWIKTADEDLGTVALLLEKGGSSNPACFHAQQAAEKYLKGFLAHHERHVRKIHDLGILLRNCIAVDKDFENLRDDVIYLDRFYTKTRYPDDFVEFTRSDAEDALASALRVKEFVLSKIKSQEAGSGFGFIGLIIAVAVIAVLAGGGLYFRENRQIKSQLQVGLEAEKKAIELRDKIMREQREQLEAIGEKQETQKPIPIDTSNWKTYRNEQYGYAVEYPDNWFLAKADFVIDSSQGIGDKAAFSNVQLHSSISDSSLEDESFFEVTLRRNANPRKLPVNTWYDEYFAEGMANNPISKSYTSVDGHPAVKIEVSEIGRYYHYYVIDDTNVVEIAFRADQTKFFDIYNKILYTFKFTK